MDNKYICTVCGFDSLSEPPWSDLNDKIQPGGASYEICPCCGTEFGYTDFGITKQQIIQFHIELRLSWIKGGMKWSHPKSPFEQNNPSLNWSPTLQLKNIPPEFLSPDEKY